MELKKLTKEQEKYIKLVFWDVYKGKKEEKPEHYKKIWEDKICKDSLFSKAKEYKATDIEQMKEGEFITKMMGIEKAELEKIKKEPEVEILISIRNRLKNKKVYVEPKFKNNPTKVWQWYLSQGENCYYCGISQKELKELFEKGKISSEKNSFNATLHIERKFPKEGYTENNSTLVCCLCNNAKSDMINETNYKTYFGEAMGKFLKDLAGDIIDNETIIDE